MATPQRPRVESESGRDRAYRHLQALGRELRYAIRSNRKAAPLSLAVVATLAIGVSMNATLFSIFNGLMFRPVVTRDPGSFVRIHIQLSGLWQRELHGPATLATLEDFEVMGRARHTLAALTASRWATFALGESQTASLRGKFVSCEYLSAHLGPMQAGRGLVEADCARPGGEPVVVLTHRGWQLYFAGDPRIVGREVRLNQQLLTVVGIAPDDAAGDPVAAMLYVPYTLQPALQGPLDYFREPAGRHAWLELSGRLRPGRSLREAQTEIALLAKEIDRLHPAQITGMLVTDGAIIHEPETARTMPALIVLCLGTTILILAMVCANVTTLLLARGVSRRAEMSVRISLGASRGQLIRQLLAETVTLGACAAAVSLALAWYLPGPAAQLLTDFPLTDAFAPDWRVVGLTLGLALAGGTLAGLSPALEALRFGAPDSLRPPGRVVSGQVNRRLSGTLIAHQLSVSLALLVVILTLARAQNRMLAVRLDYDAAATIVTGIDVARTGYTGASAGLFYDRLLPALQAIPGVQTVALSSPPPFRGVSRRTITIAGDTRHTVLASCRAVSPGFFAIVAVRLLHGRLFTDVETRTPAAPVPVIVSDAFARAYFPGVDSVGGRIRIGADDAEIIGVVSDTTSLRPTERDEPLIYQPLYAASVVRIAPLVRTSGDVTAVSQAIRTRVRMLDARLTATPETIEATVARDARQYATMIKMTAIPGGLALVLSLIGIYGLSAFAAAQRTHEMAVRVALGARPGEVVSLFVRSLRRPTLLGALGGSALALTGLALLRRTNLRLDVPSVDPLAYVTALVLLLGAALIATSVPAVRVSRKDAWTALKE